MADMTILPFDSVKTCPACWRGTAGLGFSVAYSTKVKVPAGSGRFVSVSTRDDDDRPHLEKHCPHCGYGWLEQLAFPDAVDHA